MMKNHVMSFDADIMLTLSLRKNLNELTLSQGGKTTTPYYIYMQVDKLTG